MLKTTMTIKSYFALALFLLALPVSAHAQQVLTVEANGTEKSYSFEELSQLPQTEVMTKNDYVDATTRFSGPTLRMILEQNGIASGAEINMHALNDFFVTAPASDAYNYDVILALLMNGEPMSVRDKGPIWIIYPMDDHPELSDDLYNGRLVWQLDKITAK
ncbi:MAG: molybdopterin-dependent oxidoreductase [Sulfitobacter sp.]